MVNRPRFANGLRLGRVLRMAAPAHALDRDLGSEDAFRPVQVPGIVHRGGVERSIALN